MPSVPKNWIGCPNFATRLVGNFFAFKTPVSEEINRNLGAGDKLYIRNVLEEIKKFNVTKSKILWIDLTNTDRYYRRNEIRQADGVEYVKMALEGQSLPQKRDLDRFMLTCDKFLNQNPNGCIAIHCTHGFNRTGYLICKYIILRKKYKPLDAFNEFCSARPPGIYRQVYVNDIFCSDKKSIPPSVSNPSWARPERGGVPQSRIAHSMTVKRTWDKAQGDDTTRVQSSSDCKKSIRAFYVNVPGVAYFSNGSDTLIQAVRDLTNAEDSESLFPNPVNLSKDSIRSFTQDIRMSETHFTWESTGKRLILFIINHQTFFLSEENDLWIVLGLNFLNKNKQYYRSGLDNTVLLGEMTRMKNNFCEFPAFLIADIFAIDGKSVGHLPFAIRQRCLEEEIIQPRAMGMRSRIFDVMQEPFAILSKPCLSLSEFANVLDPNFEFGLSHAPSALIFHSISKPIRTGAELNRSYKWKLAPNFETACFTLKLRPSKGVIADLLVANSSVPFASVPYSANLVRKQCIDGSKVECTYADLDKSWTIVGPTVRSPDTLLTATNVQLQKNCLNQRSDTSSSKIISKVELLNTIAACCRH